MSRDVHVLTIVVICKLLLLLHATYSTRGFFILGRFQLNIEGNEERLDTISRKIKERTM